jgi:hypothetical protein
MTSESDDVSLWEQLGIDANAITEPLPDDTFARMLEVAVDPATPEADPDLLPPSDDALDPDALDPDALDPDALDPDALDLDPVDPSSLHGHDPHAVHADHPDLGADDLGDDLDSGDSVDSPLDSDGGDVFGGGDGGTDGDSFDVGGHDY